MNSVEMWVNPKGYRLFDNIITLSWFNFTLHRFKLVLVICIIAILAYLSSLKLTLKNF
jgi:hypothetical protein